MIEQVAQNDESIPQNCEQVVQNNRTITKIEIE